MPAAIAIPAIIGAAGSIGGAALSAHAAGKAANAQVDAANHAADLQHADASQALGLQQREYTIGQAELNPYLQAGYGGLANLQSLLGITPRGNTYDASSTAFPSSAGVPNAAPQTLASLNTNRDLPVGRAGAAVMGNNGRPISFDPRTNVQPVSNIRQGALTPAEKTLTGGSSGTTSLASLVNPDLGGFGSLMQPYGEKFTAPTAATEQNDPGYQFRLDQGEKALQNSAAAKGTLLNGKTAADINSFGQNYASNEYGNVYNRALGEYQNRYNIFQNDQTNKYNRLASLAGIGQTTANQLNSAGQNFANQSGNILMNSGQQIGQQYNNAGAARASGYVGGANAWAGALDSLGGYATLASLLKKNPNLTTVGQGSVPLYG